jgi:hypothetical protein
MPRTVRISLTLAANNPPQPPNAEAPRVPPRAPAFDTPLRRSGKQPVSMSASAVVQQALARALKRGCAALGLKCSHRRPFHNDAERNPGLSLGVNGRQAIRRLADGRERQNPGRLSVLRLLPHRDKRRFEIAVKRVVSNKGYISGCARAVASIRQGVARCRPLQRQRLVVCQRVRDQFRQSDGV